VSRPRPFVFQTTGHPVLRNEIIENFEKSPAVVCYNAQNSFHPTRNAAWRMVSQPAKSSSVVVLPAAAHPGGSGRRPRLRPPCLLPECCLLPTNDACKGPPAKRHVPVFPPSRSCRLFVLPRRRNSVTLPRCRRHPSLFTHVVCAPTPEIVPSDAVTHSQTAQRATVCCHV